MFMQSHIGDCTSVAAGAAVRSWQAACSSATAGATAPALATSSLALSQSVATLHSTPAAFLATLCASATAGATHCLLKTNGICMVMNGQYHFENH